MNKNTNTYAVILAGGEGSRMGYNIPKQFIEIYNKPIIIYTLEIFQKNQNIKGIVVVCIKAFLDYMTNLVKQYNLSKVISVIEGGDNFQKSVINSMNYLKKIPTYDDNVLIHMSVAPFIDDEIIDDSISVCNKFGNGFSANDMLLCMGLREKDSLFSTKGINRDELVGLNTPQTCKFFKLNGLYERAIKSKEIESIEPHISSLLYYYGEKIYFSKGSSKNIKITTKDDLELFKSYVYFKNNGGIKND